MKILILGTTKTTTSKLGALHQKETIDGCDNAVGFFTLAGSVFPRNLRGHCVVGILAQ